MIKILKNQNNNSNKYQLSFSNLSLKSGNKIILENENLNLNFSNMVIIKGMVGAGKSTLLKMIGGIIKSENGNFLLSSKDCELETVYIHSQPELNFITGFINDELHLAGITDFTPFERYLNKTY